VPLATHLAETRAELEVLRERTGPLVPFLQGVGVWEPEGLAQDAAEVARLCSAAPRLLLVHVNYLAAEAVPPGATVVYCPRTHAAFGHPPHAFRDFLARGVRVALGTDSLASNPDLDMLAEACFLHARYPEVPGADLLRMATLAGAEALGWQDEAGSLTPGKSADLVAVPLPADGGEPHELVLRSAAPGRAVLCRGRWLCGEPALTSSDRQPAHHFLAPARGGSV
jgi:cytosine/adenosine deaminase-related metal-dependent hydrolase